MSNLWWFLVGFMLNAVLYRLCYGEEWLPQFVGLVVASVFAIIDKTYNNTNHDRNN